MNPNKVEWKAGTVLSPVPVVLVTCGLDPTNIVTIAWIGIICTNPPMLSISIRPERHSHALIETTKEFVVNLPSAKMVKSVDYCGVKSGQDINKWTKTGLTPQPSRKIQTPQILECPVSLECLVRNQIKLGSHDCFMAEIVSVSVDAELMDEKGYFNMGKANLLVYSHGHYYDLGNTLGHFGFSIKKKKSVRKHYPRGSSPHRS